MWRRRHHAAVEKATSSGDVPGAQSFTSRLNSATRRGRISVLRSSDGRRGDVADCSAAGVRPFSVRSASRGGWEVKGTAATVWVNALLEIVSGTAQSPGVNVAWKQNEVERSPGFQRQRRTALSLTWSVHCHYCGGGVWPCTWRSCWQRALTMNGKWN